MLSTLPSELKLKICLACPQNIPSLARTSRSFAYLLKHTPAAWSTFLLDTVGRECALTYYIEKGGYNSSIIQNLVRFGALISPQTTLLCGQKGHLEAFKLLLRHLADKDRDDGNTYFCLCPKEKALLVAIKRSDVDLARFVISEIGAVPTSSRNFEEAAKRNSSELLDLLFEHGKPSRKTLFRVFTSSVGNGNLSMATRLLEEDMFVRYKAGRERATDAIRNGALDTLKLLLNQGFLKPSQLLLQNAAEYDQIDIAKMLMEKGAVVLPLHLLPAIKCKNLELLRLYSADLLRQIKNGKADVPDSNHYHDDYAYEYDIHDRFEERDYDTDSDRNDNEDDSYPDDAYSDLCLDAASDDIDEDHFTDDEVPYIGFDINEPDSSDDDEYRNYNAHGNLVNEEDLPYDDGALQDMESYNSVDETERYSDNAHSDIDEPPVADDDAYYSDGAYSVTNEPHATGDDVPYGDRAHADHDDVVSSRDRETIIHQNSENRNDILDENAGHVHGESGNDGNSVKENDCTSDAGADSDSPETPFTLDIFNRAVKFAFKHFHLPILHHLIYEIGVSPDHKTLDAVLHRNIPEQLEYLLRIVKDPQRSHSLLPIPPRMLNIVIGTSRDVNVVRMLLDADPTLTATYSGAMLVLFEGSFDMIDCLARRSVVAEKCELETGSQPMDVSTWVATARRLYPERTDILDLMKELSSTT